MTKIDRTKPQDFGVSYMERALTDVNGIIADLREATRGVKYDTIVVTGSSGMMVGPILARALRKNLFVVRKEAEYESSHSYSKFLGTLGHRWIFVDDFCSSGQTFKRVRDGVRDAVKDINRPRSWWDENAQLSRYEDWRSIVEFETELVGYFEYQRPENGFTKWDIDAKPGYSDFYRSDTPAVVAEKARQAERREERDAKRYAETVNLSVDVKTPSVGDFEAEYRKQISRAVCGEGAACDICKAEARDLVERTLGRPWPVDAL